MKTLKRTVSVFLAALMILSSMSAFATINDGKSRTMTSQVRFYRCVDEENDVWEETVRVAPGDKVQARVVLQSDFIVGTNFLYYLYNKNVFEIDTDTQTSTLDSYDSSKRGGTFYWDDDNSGITNELINKGYLDSSVFDDYGSVYFYAKTGLSGYFDGVTEVYTANFVVKEEAPIGEIGTMFIPTETVQHRMDDDPTFEYQPTYAARVTAADQIGIDVGIVDTETSEAWADPFEVDNLVSTNINTIGAAQGLSATDISNGIVATYSSASVETSFVTVTDKVTVNYCVPAYNYFDENDETTWTQWQYAEEYTTGSGARKVYHYDQTYPDSVTVFLGEAPVCPGTYGMIQDIPEGYYFAGWAPDDGSFDASTIGTYNSKLADIADTVEGTGYDYSAVDGTKTGGDPDEYDCFVADPNAAKLKPITSDLFDSYIYEDEDTGDLSLDVVAVLLPIPIDDVTVTFNAVNKPDGTTATTETEISIAPGGQLAADNEDIPAAPEVEGYSFSWYSDEDCTTPVVFPVTINSDTEFYGAYTPNTYTLYKVIDGGEPEKVADYAYGATIAEVAPATKTGYTFSGWKTAADLETAYTFGTMPAGDVTIYGAFTANEYTITFKNEDGTVLQSSDWEYGATPVYSGETPTKAADAQYTYTFDGWDNEIIAVTGEATYTATYTSTVNKYTIKFVDEDGTELQSSDWEYGETPVYSGETPTKAADAQFTYTFDGWDNEIADVTGVATYTATYTSTVNKYTIKFVNEDGTELQSGKVAYNDMPAYTGATPTKAADAQYTYTFSGWNPEVTAVTGDATYTATYSKTVNEYTIKFVNEDGTVLQSSDWKYGETPVYEGAAPTKAADAQFTYTFDGWDNEIAEVTGEATYTATYAPTANEYTVTFHTDADEEDSPYEAFDIFYGDDIEYPAEPEKTGYTFVGWFTEEDGEGTQYEEGDGHAMPAEDLDLYAYFTVNSYEITFLDGDGNEIQKGNVAYGEMPVYSGATPTKTATAEYTYAWNTDAPWTPAIVSVTGEATYTANFTSTPNTYTLYKVIDGGEPEKVADYAYGETIATVADATKTGYTFSGWKTDDTLATAYTFGTMPAEDVTIYGAFTAIEYTIKFVDEDGTVLQSSDWEYGETPVYSGETPTKDADAQYTYTFDGWDNEIIAVTGDATYTATYSKTVNKYDAKFVNYDDTELYTDEDVEYGAVPVYAGETPVKPSSDGKDYTFAGWSPDPSTGITGDTTYKAQFNAVGQEFTITFVDEDGTTVLQTLTNVPYGTTPAYTNEAPTKGADAQYTYTFDGWTEEIVAATADKTYTAKYSKTVNEYTIKFVNEDGTVLQSGEVAYGTMPEYEGETPTKDADAQYTYTFDGWDNEIIAVTGEATYTATYSNTVNKYTITFKNEDGTVLQSGEVAYGTMPEYEVETPTKDADAQYTYTFDGWDNEIAEVTGDATYTATYSKTVNKYTATFVNYDGSELYKAENVEYGSVPAYVGDTPVKPSSDGKDYTFAGWNPDPATGITGNTTYTAQFNEAGQEFTITFVDEDGTVLQTLTKVPYGTLPAYTNDEPTKTATAEYSYSFDGWTETIVAATADKTYTAKYIETPNTYTLYMVIDGGEPEKVADYAYGTTIAEVADATKTGYTFSGWKTYSDLATDYTFGGTMPAENVTIYGAFTAIEYTITFVDEDGTVLQSGKVAYGETPAYTEATPTKAADAQYTYTFSGWSPAIVSVTGEATYTAEYSEEARTYKVTYVVDGEEFDKISYVNGTEVNLNYYPVKDGYTFDGWYEASDCSGDKIEAPYMMPAANVTVYGKTTGNEITIVIVDEDGEAVGDPIEVNVGDVLPEIEEPEKTGYSFVGWESDTDGVLPGSTIPALANGTTVTFTAVFEANEYTATFKDELGNIYETLDVVYGEEIDVPADLDKEGIKFIAWQDADGKEPSDYTDGMPAEGVEFTAVVAYEVKYIADGTQVGTSQYAQPGETVPTFNGEEDPVKDGYTFTGWKSAEHDKAPADYTEGMPANTLTFEAQFEADKTFTFNPDGGKWSDGSIEPKTVTLPYDKTLEDAAAELADEPTKTGAEFKGWVEENGVYVPDWEDIEYTVTYYVDGEEFESYDELYYGDEIEYPDDPEKTGYTFVGWFTEEDGEGTQYEEGEQTMPAENLDLYAYFTANKYTITFVDGDGNTIQETDVEYGTMPVYEGDTPTKTATAEYTYTWNTDAPWTPAIVSVTGEATYTANFTSTPNTYTLYKVIDGGEPEKVADYAYGDTIAEVADATKTGYTFSGWKTDDTLATAYTFGGTMPAEDVTIYGAFTAIEYTITFADEDGTVLQSSDWEYGATPVYSGETPTKAADAQYTYTFSGWSPEIVPVEEDATYTATYSKTVNEYTIKFVDEDGTELQSGKAAYNDMPAYTGATPTKAADAQYTYTFSGWSPEVTAVTGDATYTATYSKTVNEYTITFVDEDGETVLQSGKVAYNDMPAYTEATPTKAADAQYTYTFSGWSPEITAVTGDATYTATYSKTVNKYTLYKVVDGGEPEFVAEYAYGDTIATVPDETKAGYTFSGWKTDDTLATDYTFGGTMPAEDVTIYGEFTLIPTPAAIVKLVPANADSTALVERDGVVETNVTIAAADYPYGVDSVIAPFSDTYGEYSSTDYAKWYVTGIPVNTKEADLANYVTVTGGGSFELENTFGNGRVGTGAVIVVKDADNNVVEKFTVVIYGDLDGNGVITNDDKVMAKSEINSRVWSSSAGKIDYMVKAADLDQNGRYSNDDRVELEKYLNNKATYNVEQTLGYVDKI